MTDCYLNFSSVGTLIAFYSTANQIVDFSGVVALDKLRVNAVLKLFDH